VLERERNLELGYSVGTRSDESLRGHLEIRLSLIIISFGSCVSVGLQIFTNAAQRPEQMRWALQIHYNRPRQPKLTPDFGFQRSGVFL
jgi:hypothetical protein